SVDDDYLRRRAPVPSVIVLPRSRPSRRRSKASIIPPSDGHPQLRSHLLIYRQFPPVVLAGMATRLPDQYLWASMRGPPPGVHGELRRQRPDRCQASGDRQGKEVRAILKGWGRALVMTATAASVIGLAAAPALAATWSVKPGGAVTGTAGKTVVTDA